MDNWQSNSWCYFHVLSTQRSNAKIQRHFRFSQLRTSHEFEEKACKIFVEKCYNNSTGREKYKVGISEDVH